LARQQNPPPENCSLTIDIDIDIAQQHRRTCVAKMPTTLDIIPEVALILFIVEQLSGKDLKNLALTCKKLERVSFPRHFAAIRISKNRKDFKADYRLLRTLMDGDAGPVRHLRIDLLYLHLPVEGTEAEPLSEEMIESLEKAVRVLLNTPVYQDIRLALRRTPNDALISLCLGQLRKLEWLEISPERQKVLCETSAGWARRYDRSLLKRVVECAPRQMPSGIRLLGSLKSVKLHGGLARFGTHVGQFWQTELMPAFFCLPTLTKFEGQELWWDGFPGWTCGEQSSNVSEIVLSNCVVFQESLSVLVKLCKSIKAFTFERPYYEMDMDISYLSLIQDLAPHKDTLETLVLLTSIYGWEEEPLEDICTGSFRSLERLRYLHLDENALYGAQAYHELQLCEMLPDALETLRFQVQSRLPDVWDLEKIALISQTSELYTTRGALQSVRLEKLTLNDVEWETVLRENTGVPLRRIKAREDVEGVIEWVRGDEEDS
jgi:hypothetical protein